ncbi:hypothetical protein K502DRAFT_349133 [Neoconidiobolus thromboides FSU 785]|nr:hypothetical protein K502DRAFT_349133 [Neoconidiobolus thromboides FSU 785]
MNAPLTKKLRSEVDKRRYRVDALEYNIKSVITRLERLKRLDGIQLVVYHKYLAKCMEILRQLKQDTFSLYEDYDYIELLVHIYKQELEDTNINGSFDYIIKPVILLKQPATGYGTFLENGVTIYLKYINLHQVWYTHKEVNILLTNNTPDLCSHGFMALLAYFSRSKNNMLAHHIYEINFKKAKEGLIRAYANPSFSNVVGILFMCFISAHISDSASVTKYFSLVIRMAQALGYNKSASEMVEEYKRNLVYSKRPEEIKIEFKRKERGMRLWESLSFIYYSYLSIYPNMPNLNVNFKLMETNLLKSVENGLQANDTSSPSGSQIDGAFSSSELEKIYGEKIVTEASAEIVAHIQKIKLNYLRKDVIDKIPQHELELTKERFSIVLTNLTSQLVYNPSLYDKVKKIDSKKQTKKAKIIQKYYEFNTFNYHLNSFVHLTLIYLYYPSVLVFPKPKRFTINEAILLNKSAQSIAEFYLIIKQNNIQQSHGRNCGAFACARSELASANGFYLNFEGPFYTPIMHVVYVYLAFISKENWLLAQKLRQRFIIKAKCYVLRLLRLLKAVLDSESKSERLESLNTIQFIKKNLGNYMVDKMFLKSINSIIG